MPEVMGRREGGQQVGGMPREHLINRTTTSISWSPGRHDSGQQAQCVKRQEEEAEEEHEEEEEKEETEKEVREENEEENEENDDEEEKEENGEEN